MSEMVERVARAMFAASEPASDWDDEGGRHQEQWRTEARAAILAMRDPTDTMLSQYFEGKSRETFVYHWQKGIDEALR